MVDLILNNLPGIITGLVAIGTVIARTTDTAIDNKLVKLARDNREGIVSAVRSLASDSKRGKKE